MLLYMPAILEMQYQGRTSVLQLVLTVAEKETLPAQRISILSKFSFLEEILILEMHMAKLGFLFFFIISHEVIFCPFVVTAVPY